MAEETGRESLGCCCWAGGEYETGGDCGDCAFLLLDPFEKRRIVKIEFIVCGGF